MVFVYTPPYMCSMPPLAMRISPSILAESIFTSASAISSDFPWIDPPPARNVAPLISTRVSWPYTLSASPPRPSPAALSGLPSPPTMYISLSSQWSRGVTPKFSSIVGSSVRTQTALQQWAMHSSPSPHRISKQGSAHFIAAPHTPSGLRHWPSGQGFSLAHSPLYSSLAPSISAWHELEYVCISHPHTGFQISIQTSGFLVHLPLRMPALLLQAPGGSWQ
mmetsp:Transcript_40153/g.68495  ORF Transcript_40153/g.68495 Transcript_40153/m.68495 type:complete len:221 (-) Transcript_40153:514-1176(-)